MVVRVEEVDGLFFVNVNIINGLDIFHGSFSIYFGFFGIKETKEIGKYKRNGT